MVKEQFQQRRFAGFAQAAHHRIAEPQQDIRRGHALLLAVNDIPKQACVDSLLRVFDFSVFVAYNIISKD